MPAEIASVPCMDIILGIDPGIRGGAGFAFVEADTGRLVGAWRVERDPGRSTIQMMRDVRDALASVFMVMPGRIIAVAREDHVFPQAIERIARNILRRLNGVIDVTVTDKGYVEGESYFGFPVGTWKVLAGMPGDLGKEHKGAQKGERSMLGSRRKKGTEAQYLAAINVLLGHEHKTVDEADAHGIASAARTVWNVRRGVSLLHAMPLRVAESLWDKEKAGMTVTRAFKQHAGLFGNCFELRKYLRDFAL